MTPAKAAPMREDVTRLISELRNPWQHNPTADPRGPLPDWAGVLLSRAATAIAGDGADHELIVLLSEVEMHLKSVRIFISTREKIHPVGLDLHDEVLASVTARLEDQRHRLAQTARPDAGDDYVLPCDVHLPIAAVIKAGCTLGTLKLAMELEGRPRNFEGNPRDTIRPDAGDWAKENAAYRTDILWWSEIASGKGYDSITAALTAAPRSGAGEDDVERVARAIWDVLHPTGTSWDDWARLIAEKGDGYDGRNNARNLALAALAAMREGVDRGMVEREAYLVWSNEHSAWWGVNQCGYTRFIERAGRYDRAEALSIAGTRDGGWHVRKGNPDEIAIPEKDAIKQYADITRSQATEGQPR
jgi:hypothetical protein